VPAWVSAGAALISGGFGGWAAVSAWRANKAKGVADTAAQAAVEAQQQSAAAHSEIAALLGDQIAGLEAAQARRVVVETSIQYGRNGFVVRNGNDEPIYDLEIHPVSDQTAVINLSGNNPVRVQGPLKRDMLSPREPTQLWQLMGATDGMPVADQVRITFEDAQRRPWERVGNREPVKREA
jgi:hypothetical protein